MVGLDSTTQINHNFKAKRSGTVIIIAIIDLASKTEDLLKMIIDTITRSKFCDIYKKKSLAYRNGLELS